MANKNFKSILDLLKTFPDEQTCVDYLELQRWKGNVVSPFDPESKVYKCRKNQYRCKNTGKYFNVRTGTMYDNTKVPLRKWFVAIYLVTSHKKGISSCQLAKDINVTQKTAWFLLIRIRNCFDKHEDVQLDGTIEIDETFVGGKNKNRHKDKKVPQSQGRSFKDKTPVFGMLQRNGTLIARAVKDTKSETLKYLIDRHIKEGSIINTDEWNYGNLHEKYIHRQVFHAKKVYAIGENNTNSIEGFWGIFKRGMIGIYNHVSRKHIQYYINEFTFRYNTRKISESDRFELYLHNMKHRLKYKDLKQ